MIGMNQTELEIAYKVVREMANELKKEMKEFNSTNSFFKTQLEALDRTSSQIFDRLESKREMKNEMSKV